MTFPWRALLAPALLASALATAGPAAANDECTYYKWNATERRWHRVALLVDRPTWEQGRTQGVDWDCPYCVTLPIPPRPDDGGVTGAVPDLGEQGSALLAPVAATVDTLRETLRPFGVVLPDAPEVSVDVNPFGDPEPPGCPRLPPERYVVDGLGQDVLAAVGDD